MAEGMTAGVFFGTAAVLIRFLPDTDAFYIAFWRLVIASFALVTILIVLRKPFGFDVVRKNLKDFILLGFFLGLHFIFFVSAVKDTTILNATVLVNTTPIFSIFVSAFAFKLKPSRFAIVGLSISFIGVCAIAYGEASTGKSPAYSPSIKGDIEAVLAALVESFYLNFGRRIRNKMGILSIMLPVYLLSAALIGVLGVATARTIIEFPTETWIVIPLLGLGLIPTALAHTLYFSSLSNLKSFETAAMAFLEPIGATILGIAFFHEIPAPLFAFGAALTLAGILFIASHGE